MREQAFIAASDRLTAWCKTALKYWAKTAADPQGGVCEHILMSGAPDFDHIRRVRVQFRQAYVYAHAAHLGWYDGAKGACDQAWDFATGPGSAGADFVPGSGPRGCAHLVHGDGAMHNDMRDTYAQAFVLLAGAWRYRAFNDGAALKTANATLAFLDQHVKAPNGGWFESLPLPTQTMRRQNPHMHLFEAFLALYDATKDSVYLDRAVEIFDLFKAHFFDEKTGALFEFFNADWSRRGDGGPIEPGHMMEWCWLLRCYEKHSGVDVGHYADALYAAGIDYGWNDTLGLLYDAVSYDRAEVKKTLRTWPQTELLKASVAQAASGQSVMLDNAANCIDALMNSYLNVDIEGGWVDQLDENGHVLSTVMPTSTFYHLFCAAAEAHDLAHDLRAQP